jgi:hypothetical protein
MTGSEKQIQWATQIQQSFIDGLSNPDGGTFAMLRKIGQRRVDAERLTREQYDNLLRLFEDALAKLTAERQEAAWWIDHRNQMHISLLHPYLPEPLQRNTHSMILDNAAKMEATNG